MVSMDSSFAGPMKAHVLTTRTSADWGSWVSSQPARAKRPIITSESTRFFAQPKETIPTLMGRVGAALEEVDIAATPTHIHVVNVHVSWRNRIFKETL